MLKSLTALLLLAIPALAGSQVLGPNDNTVTLDTPPPGATQLVLSVDWSHSTTFGMENLGAATTMDSRLTSGFSLNHGTTPLVQDRAYTYCQGAVSAYDGVLDYGGTSGITTSNSANKTAGSTYTYSTAPTTLSFVRRWRIDTNLASYSSYYNSSITATVNWTWQ